MYEAIIWFEIAAFVLSLLALPVIWKSRYMRIYPLVLFIVVAVEGYYSFFPVATYVNPEVYNIQIPLQYVCYHMILFYAGDGKVFRFYLIIAIVAIVVFTAVSNYLVTAGHSNVWSYSFCSILIIIGIVWKCYEMLKDPASFNFLRNPFFYMLFAFLIFNLGTLPYFSMANWLYHTTQYRYVFNILVSVMSILNFILYTTYSICFIWIIRKKGFY
ncbi:MAG: hypothetical protein QM764_22105 [Chitinophagaceae bacterium]